MIWQQRGMLLAMLVTAGCGAARWCAPSSAAPAFAVHSIALPGAPSGGVFMDYLAYDPAYNRVWVPAGNTGNVVVVDAATGRVATVAGFSTAEIQRHGTNRLVGPSSATAGDGVVYVGNRGDDRVCAVDAASLRRGPCIKLDSTPDGLAYVAATQEVWVTTPRDRSIVVLDVATPGAVKWKATVRLDGQPEGFAVDDARGLFYTNLEDKDRTLTIDIRRRQVMSAWQPSCGQGGPKGLALDRHLNFLFVACRDRVMVLDAGHGGARRSTLATGDGIDNIDYVEARHELYAAAAHAATLTIAHLDPQGGLTPLAVVATVTGARNAVATRAGAAYLTDSAEGRILVVTPAVSP